MSVVREYVIGNEGDASVGLDGFRDRVTVIFHRWEGEFTNEDEETLAGALAEIADGYCTSLALWEQEQRLEAVADALDADRHAGEE